MKKTIVAAFTVAFLSTNTAYALFGGSDGSSTLAEQLVQTKELVDQTQSMSNQLIAQTGIRDILSFQRDIQDLTDFMDSYSLDFMDLSNDIIDQPKSQLGQYAKNLFNKYQLFDDCNYDYMSTDQKRICKGQMVRNVQEIATYQMTTNKLKSISQKLTDLSEQRTDSNDVKSSQDISNAIQSQIAQLQLIQTQLDMMESQNRAKERIDKRQKEQLYKQNRNNRYDWK